MNKEGSRVICNPVCLKRCRDRVTYDSRPFLVHLVFADLSSLHPSSFHEMIFTLVAHIFYGRLRARTQCIRAIRACALKTTPILELAQQWRHYRGLPRARRFLIVCEKSRYCFEQKDHARERTSPICTKIKTYRRSRDALGRLRR